MTPRERLTAVARGGPVDKRPVVLLPGRQDQRADAIAVGPKDVADCLEKSEGQAVLGHVVSPLGMAMRSGIALTKVLSDDLEAGAKKLEELTEQARSEMREALDQGADGVFYELDGAYPSQTTPMEYGGHFLEVDRQLLDEVKDARFNVLYVCGDEDPYVDFVIDLPAHAFAWDVASGADFDEVRRQREGALAAKHPGADVLLAESFEEAESLAQKTEVAG